MDEVLNLFLYCLPQYGSGADLSILLAEVFQTSKAAVEDENIGEFDHVWQSLDCFKAIKLSS